MRGMMRIERTRTTESEAMRTLHDAHAAALWSFAMRLTGGDRAAAEDVVQETLLRAWRNPNSPVFSQQQDGSARSWLYTVARRIVIDEWRSRSARPETLVDDIPEPRRSTIEESDRIIEAQLISDALGRLTPEHHAVLREVYFRRSTVSEAARSLGIAEGTVKSRTHYALRSLKLALTEMGVNS
jgi:RNA polymerase sigma-70 factor (ECF subfamily)